MKSIAAVRNIFILLSQDSYQLLRNGRPFAKRRCNSQRTDFAPCKSLEELGGWIVLCDIQFRLWENTTLPCGIRLYQPAIRRKWSLEFIAQFPFFWDQEIQLIAPRRCNGLPGLLLGLVFCHCRSGRGVAVSVFGSKLAELRQSDSGLPYVFMHLKPVDTNYVLISNHQHIVYSEFPISKVIRKAGKLATGYLAISPNYTLNASTQCGELLTDIPYHRYAWWLYVGNDLIFSGCNSGCWINLVISGEICRNIGVAQVYILSPTRYSITNISRNNPLTWAGLKERKSIFPRNFKQITLFERTMKE